MHYVYIIRSLVYPNQLYIGRTGNIEQRLNEHNNGWSSHTSKYKPWELLVYIAFKDEGAAIKHEIYLKSGSGRAFVNQRLLINLP
jgi:predicted GIY-YIG superfamily endonuclease